MNNEKINQDREFETRKLVPAALVTYLTTTFVATPTVVTGIAVAISAL
jgi:hypothetical protein